MREPPPANSPLDYAPPLRRGAIWKRRIAILLIVCLTLAILLRIGPAAYRYAKLNYLIRPCMSETLPADRVVMDPAAPNAQYISAAWFRFASQLYPHGASQLATLFCHERFTPDGRRKLVEIDGFIYLNKDYEMILRVIDPGSIMRAPREDVTPVQLHEISLPAGAIFFAGQVDPVDASHFTVTARSDAGTTVFDGWLGNDDTLRIEPRTTPATQPAPQ